LERELKTAFRKYGGKKNMIADSDVAEQMLTEQSRKRKTTGARQGRAELELEPEKQGNA